MSWYHLQSVRSPLNSITVDGGSARSLVSALIVALVEYLLLQPYFGHVGLMYMVSDQSVLSRTSILKQSSFISNLSASHFCKR